MPTRAETLCWWLLAYLVLTAPDECFRNSSVPLWSNLWVMQHVKSDLPLVRTCAHPKVKQVDSHEIPPFKMQQNVSWIVNQSSLPRSRYTMVQYTVYKLSVFLSSSHPSTWNYSHLRLLWFPEQKWTFGLTNRKMISFIYEANNDSLAVLACSSFSITSCYFPLKA